MSEPTEELDEGLEEGQDSESAQPSTGDRPEESFESTTDEELQDLETELAEMTEATDGADDPMLLDDEEDDVLDDEDGVADDIRLLADGVEGLAGEVGMAVAPADPDDSAMMDELPTATAGGEVIWYDKDKKLWLALAPTTDAYKVLSIDVTNHAVKWDWVRLRGDVV